MQFAKGVCETEATLDAQIKNMVAQIKLIDKCDTLSQNDEKNKNILEVQFFGSKNNFDWELMCRFRCW